MNCTLFNENISYTISYTKSSGFSVIDLYQLGSVYYYKCRYYKILLCSKKLFFFVVNKLYYTYGKRKIWPFLNSQYLWTYASTVESKKSRSYSRLTLCRDFALLVQWATYTLSERDYFFTSLTVQELQKNTIKFFLSLQVIHFIWLASFYNSLLFN